MDVISGNAGIFAFNNFAKRPILTVVRVQHE
jgi:hypothetical protein